MVHLIIFFLYLFVAFHLSLHMTPAALHMLLKRNINFWYVIKIAASNNHGNHKLYKPDSVKCCPGNIGNSFNSLSLSLKPFESVILVSEGQSYMV